MKLRPHQAEPRPPAAGRRARQEHDADGNAKIDKAELFRFHKKAGHGWGAEDEDDEEGEGGGADDAEEEGWREHHGRRRPRGVGGFAAGLKWPQPCRPICLPGPSGGAGRSYATQSAA